MGQIVTLGPFHRAEIQMKKSNGIIEYTPQPQEEMLQLDTEVDQKGNTTVDHVFKRTRDVYGQRARDLKIKKVDWSEYMTPLKHRPSPYDFPAFEHEERPKSKALLVSKESKVKKVKSNPSQQKEKTKSHSSKDIKEQNPTLVQKKSMKESKGPQTHPKLSKARVSHNKDLDHCSLED